MSQLLEGLERGEQAALNKLEGPRKLRADEADGQQESSFGLTEHAATEGDRRQKGGGTEEDEEDDYDEDDEDLTGYPKKGEGQDMTWYDDINGW